MHSAFKIIPVAIFAAVLIIGSILYSDNTETLTLSKVSGGEFEKNSQTIQIKRSNPVELTFDVPQDIDIQKNQYKLRFYVDKVNSKEENVEAILINEEQDSQRIVMSLRATQDQVVLEAEISSHISEFVNSANQLTIRLVADNVEIASHYAKRDMQPAIIAERNVEATETELKGYYIIMSGVTVDDLAGASRPAQLAKSLVSAGYDVTYVTAGSDSQSAYRQKSGKLVNVDLNTQSNRFHTLDISQFSSESFFASVESDKSVTVLIEAPHVKFLQLGISMKENYDVVVIYDIIDDWSGNWGSDMGAGELESRAIYISDVVSAVVPTLVQKYENEYNRKVLYVPNAADEKMFDVSKDFQKPVDMPEGKTALYYGTLDGTWFDWDLVVYLAANLPEYTFVFIGAKNVLAPNWNPSVEKYSNVKFLGMKPQSSLPAYVAHATTMVIPWKVDTIALGASPLKVYEWIAMEKAVVVSQLTQLEGFPGVSLSSSYKNFALNLKKAETFNPETVDYESFIAKNNWAGRTKLFIDAANDPSAYSGVAYVPAEDAFWTTSHYVLGSYGNGTNVTTYGNVECGTSSNTSNVIANGTVQAAWEGGNTVIAEDSVSFFFWTQIGIIFNNDTLVTVTNEDKAVFDIEATGNMTEPGNITVMQEKVLMIALKCKEFVATAPKDFTIRVETTFYEMENSSSVIFDFKKSCKNTAPPSTTSGSSSNGGGGFSAGEIAGIVIGSVVGAVIIIGAAIYFYRKRSAAGYETVPQYD